MENMKTLDEVIETAPYVGTEWTNDALHYLKKLKRIEAKIEKIAIGNVEDTLSKMDNPPLTWDELKQMEGKPVWMEYGCDFNQKRWVIIGSFHGRKNEFQYMDVSGGYPNTFWKKDMGADEFWQAYRKEKHENGD